MKPEIRFSRRQRCWIVVAAVVLIILAWPVENWLECRDRQVHGGELPDAIYLVAGSKDQPRRVEALVDFYAGKTGVSAGTNTYPVILVGNDRLKCRWCPEDQLNLTRSEWSVRAIKEKLSPGIPSLEIVPGRFGGTDGEMEALSVYLDKHRDLNRLVITTSPFHVRRTLARLDKYISRRVEVKAVVARSKWTDRAPWTVLGELFKMGRDSLGLSRVPLLSRRSS